MLGASRFPIIGYGLSIINGAVGNLVVAEIGKTHFALENKLFPKKRSNLSVMKYIRKACFAKRDNISHLEIDGITKRSICIDDIYYGRSI